MLFNRINIPIRNVIGEFLIRISSSGFIGNILNSIKLKNDHIDDSGISLMQKYKLFPNTTNICPKVLYEFKPSMRFIQFCKRSNIKQPHVGIVSECGSKFIELPINKCFNGDMIDFIQNIQSNSPKQLLKNHIKSLIPHEITDDIFLLPPIMKPEKIICIANNYCNNNYCPFDERFKQAKPIFCSKFANSLIGPNDDIQCHQSTNNKLDYGISLAVIIGKTGRNINKNDVKNYIFGYTIAQDITVKNLSSSNDSEHNNYQLLIEKSMDTFCPMGPCIIHKSAIKNVHNLDLHCKLNDEIIQIGNTNDMIYGIEDVICELSKYLTFKPGDIILTGSPGKLCSRCNKDQKQNYLKDGDCIVSEIQCIGKLINYVVQRST